MGTHRAERLGPSRYPHDSAGWDTFRSTQSLWDGSDPATGYDLLPDAYPPHASFRWADGTPSGFAIRNISPAGATMSAELTAPW